MNKAPFINKKIQPEQLVEHIEQWYSCGWGQSLLALEKALIDEALASSFGYYLLQLSISRKLCLFDNARVQHKFQCHPFGGGSESLRSDFGHLPFASDSLDVVIVHHCHEFVSAPQQVLREVERVMVNNGQLILLGFNPWSLLGAAGRISGVMPRSMWQNQWLSYRRLSDWLALLGFQVKFHQFGYHRPPFMAAKAPALGANKTRLDKLLAQLPTGGFYFISAVKQPPAMIPVTPRWAPPSPFAGLAGVKPRVSNGRIGMTKKDRT